MRNLSLARRRATRLLAAALLAATSLPAAERWAVRYFHDQDENSLQIQAFRFASARRGVAAGLLVPSKGGRNKPVALVTSDAGDTWSEVELKETPVDLFFFDESSGWMVTDRGIWFTDEAGRSWRKVLDRRGLSKTWFVSRERGFAIGEEKAFLETRDSGKTWRDAKIPELKTSKEYTNFQAIGFATPKIGMVIGHSRPPRKESRNPDWLEGRPDSRREWPSLMISLETRDAGDNWTSQVQSVFGSVTRVAMTASARGLILIEYLRSFSFRSEIITLNLSTGKSGSSFRSPTVAISDLLLTSDKRGFAAGVDVPGKVRMPVPYKVKLYRSSDLMSWQAMDVDYRAVAQRVYLSMAGEKAWAATDTGMLLQLVTE